MRWACSASPSWALPAGGPYAAACACRIPDRLTGVGFLAAMGPLDFPGSLAGMPPRNRLYFRLARWAPALLAAVFGSVSRSLEKDPDGYVRRANRGLPHVDREALVDSGLWPWMLADLGEALRQGGRGPAWDAGLYLRPWGFRLEQIAVPSHLWHGENDRYVPPGIAARLAQSIPGCQAEFIPGLGHLSLFIRGSAKALLALSPSCPG